MASSITINGNLCADPELGEATNGSVYAKVRIADDQYGRDPIFWSCRAWDDNTKIFQSAKKGSSMFIIGTLEQWKDEETEKVYTTVRVVSAGYNGGKKKDKSGLPF